MYVYEIDIFLAACFGLVSLYFCAVLVLGEEGLDVGEDVFVAN